MDFQEYKDFVYGRMVNAPHAPTTLTRPIYFGLKMSGESNELLEHIRLASDQKLILKECGDVLWYVVAVAKDLDIDVAVRAQERPGWLVQWEIGDWADYACVAVGKFNECLGKAMRDDGYGQTETSLREARAEKLKQHLEEVLFGVAGVAHIFGLRMHEVAQLNYEKLVDRDNRGVSKGDGDER